VFAAAASGVDITRPITVEGKPMSLAHLKITPGSLIHNQTVSAVEQKYNLSVVFIRCDDTSDFHPPADCCITEQDEVAILGGPDEIRSFVSDNHSSN
jgi:Trk K+ transport system NAD-binding subunit